MPAKINAAKAAPSAFTNPLDLSRFGSAGSGMLFLDAAGDTYIGTEHSSTHGNLKLTRVSKGGKLARMVESGISWPLRIAPPGHIVTFEND